MKRKQWLYLVMSRDRIHGENIGHLIEILQDAHKDNITYFADGYTENQPACVYSGIDAMMRFVQRCHPTGAIFNSKVFRTIPDKVSYFETSDAYPENYLRRDMLLHGSGASIMSNVYHWGDFLIDFTRVKSTFDVNKDTSNIFFSPKRQTKQYRELIDMIDELDEVFSVQERDKFFSQKIYALLRGVSIGYREACVYEQNCKHYGFEPRHVPVLEMVQNIFRAYRHVKAHLREKGTYTRRRDLIMYNCIAKTVIYLLKVLTRRGAKKVLEPLGVWQLLKRVKEKVLYR